MNHMFSSIHIKIEMMRDRMVFTRVLRGLSICSIIFFVIAMWSNMQDSLWRDEAFSAIAIAKSPSEIIAIARADNNPPLYHLLVHYITQVLGTSEFTLRLLSLLAVIGTILLVRYLIKNAITKEIATILFLTNPSTYLQATEGRYYALLMFITFCIFAIIKKFFATKNPNFLIAYIILSIILLYTHSLGVVIFALNTVFLTAALLRNERRKDHMLWIQFALATIGIFIAYIPWIVTLFHQYSNLGLNQFWLQFHPIFTPVIAFFGLVMMIPDKLLRFSYIGTDIFIVLGAIIALVIFINGIIATKKKGTIAYSIYFLMVFVAFYLLSFKQAILYGRYIFFLFPFLIYICAMGIKYIYLLGKNISWIVPNKNYITLAITLLWFFTNILVYTNIYAQDTKPPMKALAGIVHTQISRKYIVITRDEYLYYQCLYYFKICYINKPLNKINRSVGIALISPSSIITDEILATSPTILVVYEGTSNPRQYSVLTPYVQTDTFDIQTQIDVLHAALFRRVKGW